MRLPPCSIESIDMEGGVGERQDVQLRLRDILHVDVPNTGLTVEVPLSAPPLGDKRQGVPPMTPKSAPPLGLSAHVDADAARLVALDERYRSRTSLQPRVKTRRSNLPPGAVRGGYGQHSCPYPGCERRFTLTANLRVHVRTIHYQERPYPCPHPGCLKRFTQRGNANTHYRTVHMREMRFRCPVLRCGKRFGQKANLLLHALKLHGLGEVDLLLMGMDGSVKDD